jgi:hypothetical protein
MTHLLSNKLAALAVALMINGAMIGGIAHLFGAHFEPTAALSTLTFGHAA